MFFWGTCLFFPPDVERKRKKIEKEGKEPPRTELKSKNQTSRSRLTRLLKFTGQIESNYDEVIDSFDSMDLKPELLRGM
jgi:hypothetical protein